MITQAFFVLFCHTVTFTRGKILFPHKNLNNESYLDIVLLFFPLFIPFGFAFYIAVLIGHFCSAHACYVIYELRCYYGGRLWPVKEAGSTAGGTGGHSVDLQWRVWKSDPRAIVGKKKVKRSAVVKWGSSAVKDGCRQELLQGMLEAQRFSVL